MASSEPIDVRDRDGAIIGRRSRAEVHAAGLWHRVVHVWLVDVAGGALLYQLRSATAASWHHRLDATVGGHLRGGESDLDALREAREEIGTVLDPALLRPIGVRRHEDEGGEGVNRELQALYLAPAGDAWSRFDPRDGEAAGLFRIGLDEGQALLGGAIDALDCDGLVAIGDRVRAERRRITREDFVPRPAGYFAQVHDAARALIAALDDARA